MSAPRLRTVTIAAVDVAEAGAFLSAVCGITALDHTDHVRIPVGDAALVVGPVSAAGRVGVTGIEVETGTGGRLDTRLNGIDVSTNQEDESVPSGTSDVLLDHLAVAVADLDEAAQSWEAATGVLAELIGLHPVSNGSLLAARLALGDRMIELLSPVPGVDSAIGSRLQRHGEGPIAIALPAEDIDSKRAQLDDLGVRMLWQRPHWLIHPANPANVLIQLTPRVQH